MVFPIDILTDFLQEYNRACELHPRWYKDAIHAAGVVQEEAGELTQAANDFNYASQNHKGDDALERMKKEAIHTGAMALRFLMNLHQYEKTDGQA